MGKCQKPVLFIWHTDDLKSVTDRNFFLQMLLSQCFLVTHALLLSTDSDTMF